MQKYYKICLSLHLILAYLFNFEYTLSFTCVYTLHPPTGGSLHATENKTSKFDRTLDNFRTEKIILAPIWICQDLILVTNSFFCCWCLSPNFKPKFGSFKLFLRVSGIIVRHCSKISFCAISRKTKAPNLRKWHKN